MLHVLELIFAPPARYPDIYPVLNVLISTPVFFLAWLWSIKCGIEVGWAVGGPGPASSPTSATGMGDINKNIAGVGRAGSLGPGGDEGTGVSFRQTGGRAVSLGYAQAGSSSRRKKSGVKSGSLKSRTSSSSLVEERI